MVVAHCSNSVHVRAVVATNRRMLWREDLEIPPRRTVGFLEDFFREEVKTWPLVAGSEDYHVSFHKSLITHASFGDASGAVPEIYAVFSDLFNVPTKPLCFLCSDLAEDV